MNVGLFTSTFNLLVAASLVLIKSATREVFDWLATNPKIVVSIMVIGRLLNDVASHKVYMYSHFFLFFFLISRDLLKKVKG
jgi:hypothetical protein